MVRATLSTRLYALALKPSLLIAISSNFSASSFTGQWRLISLAPICAFACIFVFSKRFN